MSRLSSQSNNQAGGITSELLVILPQRQCSRLPGSRLLDRLALRGSTCGLPKIRFRPVYLLVQPDQDVINRWSDAAPFWETADTFDAAVSRFGVRFFPSRTETIDAKGVFNILRDSYNNRAGRDDPKAMDKLEHGEKVIEAQKRIAVTRGQLLHYGQVGER